MLFYNGEYHVIHILIIHKKKNSVTHHNELYYILVSTSCMTSVPLHVPLTVSVHSGTEQFVQELLEFSHDHFMLSLSLIILLLHIWCVTVLACMHFDGLSSTSYSLSATLSSLTTCSKATKTQ